MKKIIVFVSLLTAFCSVARAQSTPTAEQVMDKYVAAIGGKDALMKVTDLTMNMSSDMNGNTVIITRKQKSPNKSSMVINANGMEVMKQTSDGSKVVMGGMQGSRTLDGPAAQQMMISGTLFPEMRYSEMGVKTTLAGSEKVDGKDTYKLSHTTADGATTWSDSFDASTGLKVKSVFSTPQGETTTTYSDYKDTNGIKFPMTITQQTPRGPMTSTVDNVKINKGLKDSDFTAQ